MRDSCVQDEANQITHTCLASNTTNGAGPDRGNTLSFQGWAAFERESMVLKLAGLEFDAQNVAREPTLPGGACCCTTALKPTKGPNGFGTPKDRLTVGLGRVFRRLSAFRWAGVWLPDVSRPVARSLPWTRE